MVSPHIQSDSTETNLFYNLHNKRTAFSGVVKDLRIVRGRTRPHFSLTTFGHLDEKLKPFVKRQILLLQC